MFVQHCPRCKSPRIQHGFNDSPLALRLIGIRELLCNNCNLEFRGVALPGAVGRTQSSRAEFKGNRRREPRVRVRLPATVSLVEVDRVRTGVRYSTEIQSHTQELSKIGLSIVLPVMSFGDHALNNSERRLRIKLYLPSELIHLHVAPASYQRIETKKAKPDWLIGARITRMEESDRLKLYGFLSALERK